MNNENVLFGKLVSSLLNNYTASDAECELIGNDILNRIKNHPKYEEALKNTLNLYKK